MINIGEVIIDYCQRGDSAIDYAYESNSIDVIKVLAEYSPEVS